MEQTKQNTGLIRRLGAMIYDGLLVFALMFLTTLPFLAVRGWEAVETSDNSVYQLALAAAVFVFFVGHWAWRGRTLGMQSWGLQLETNDGQVPKIAAASLRFFAALISWIPLGLGFVWQLWDKDRLTWHDRISGTRIVHYPK